MWEDLRTISMVVSERQVAGEEATTDVLDMTSAASLAAKAKYTGNISGGIGGIGERAGIGSWTAVLGRGPEPNPRRTTARRTSPCCRRLAVSVLKNAQILPGQHPRQTTPSHIG